MNKSSDVMAAALDHRGVVAVSGADARPFLQGLVSQDIDKVDATHAAFGALLTPQGKFLHEFCLGELAGDLLLDCERARATDLVARLGRFRLRAKVEIEDRSEAFQVLAVFGGNGAAHERLGLDAEPGAARPLAGGLAFVDPRLAALGCRLIVPVDADLADLALTMTGIEAYDRRRLELGGPYGTRYMEID
ncbi:MAG: folate-binding protein, partial [Alphaproteobacteria bacterium]|nr:folate-binding protein [Alphaproteobacteria bacterium]